MGTKSKKIFTSVNNIYDDVFKIWCAEKKRKYNSKLIFFCHGGGFQTQEYSTQNYYLQKTCDKILVWGKNRSSNKKIKTMFNIKSSSKPFKMRKLRNDQNLKILIIQDMPPKYTNSLYSSMLHFSEYKKFVDSQKTFLNNLRNEIRRIATVRLGSSNYQNSLNNLLHYEKKIWSSGLKKVNFESRKIPIHKSIKRKNLIIITQVSSTTLLECISSNIPFLIFANPENQLVNSFFKKTLILLKKNKIFFDNPIKLSNFLNEKNSKKLNKWWKSERIQRVIKHLNENFAIYEKNPVNYLAKELRV